MDPHEHGPDPAETVDLRDASRGPRLQRILADAGIASRRACEEMIERGRVRVNGRTVPGLPAFADPERDRIEVDGRPLPRPEPHLYLMLNKPARTLSTPREGPDDARRSVLDLVEHPLSSRLFPAGRLDFEATGLLLLTNDGALANRLTHARYGVPKTYQMVVRGTLDGPLLERINRAIGQIARRASRDAGHLSPPKAELSIVSVEQGRTVLEMTARDGRIAQVRETLAALGHPIKRLERVAIGPVRLSGVAVGRWRELERHELAELRAIAAGKTIAPRRPARRTGARAGARAPAAPVASKRFRGIGARPDAPARRRAEAPETPIGDRRKGRGPGLNAARRRQDPSSPIADAKPARTGKAGPERPARSAGPRGAARAGARGGERGGVQSGKQIGKRGGNPSRTPGGERGGKPGRVSGDGRGRGSSPVATSGGPGRGSSPGPVRGPSRGPGRGPSRGKGRPR